MKIALKLMLILIMSLSVVSFADEGDRMDFKPIKNDKYVRNFLGLYFSAIAKNDFRQSLTFVNPKVRAYFKNKYISIGDEKYEFLYYMFFTRVIRWLSSQEENKFYKQLLERSFNFNYKIVPVPIPPKGKEGLYGYYLMNVEYSSSEFDIPEKNFKHLVISHPDFPGEEFKIDIIYVPDERITLAFSADMQQRQQYAQDVVYQRHHKSEK